MIRLDYDQQSLPTNDNSWRLVPAFADVGPITVWREGRRHMLEFGRNPGNPADREWLMDHIVDIYTNATEVRGGTVFGQGMVLPSGANARGPVWFYAKGTDVVVTDKSDNFVTILKNGSIMSTSFPLARGLPGRP